MRFSKLSTPDDFAAEERREALRRSCFRRYGYLIICISVALSVPGLDITSFVRALVASA
jgi:hypothetical protein